MVYGNLMQPTLTTTRQRHPGLPLSPGSRPLLSTSCVFQGISPEGTVHPLDQAHTGLQPAVTVPSGACHCAGISPLRNWPLPESQGVSPKAQGDAK